MNNFLKLAFDAGAQQAIEEAEKLAKEKKKSKKGKGVYLPKAKIERLKSSEEGKKRLRNAVRKKSKATREGKQYSRHGEAKGTSYKSGAAKDKEKDKAKFTPKHDDDKRLVGKQKSLPDALQEQILKAAQEEKKKEKKDPPNGATFSPMHDDDDRLVGKQKDLPDRLQEEILKSAAKKKKKKDPRLVAAGVDGYNKPKRTPNHPTKSHIVVAKVGDKVKTIRFGQQGVKTNQTAGQRKAFKSRHAKNIAKGKLSAAYWADKVKWSPKKTKDKKNQKWVKGS